ncbi:DNA alkylation repair protein [Alkalihalobacillus pseudalcaliphilus]|uniref:DNA alkylation repair protein n=1 Tax=Alkalihalobacillus pseudalcaliphilus TaxID=79884 RepID=UPI00064DBE81|nr:DNA alkylation repair protein [Alkalihalobacillus pseudalcaliphilus]KMK76883.1 DNA alkylation repair protein [Alkalihalobacillus pseudalcaliphilus]
MEPLKNLYTKDYLLPFVTNMKNVYPNFPDQQFYELIFTSDWEDLELKQRIRRIATAIGQTIHPYEKAIGYLREIAPKCEGFGYLFFPDFIEVYGQDNWKLSVQALKEFTPYSSSEFAVRPFIEKDQDTMLALMYEWAHDNDEHVRRLASEGARPRLPWAKPLHQLKKDPSPVLPILEDLKTDTSLYVRKSVANHLNDISKDHPQLVKKLASQWYGQHKHTDWILKHGCRTLLKQSDPDILALFGFPPISGIQVISFDLQKNIKIGDKLSFTFTFHQPNLQPTNLRIEYAIGYRKKNGKLYYKRFKLTEKTFAHGDHTYTRSHSFMNLSTRTHYSGEHELILYINGQNQTTTHFQLF